MAEWFYVQFNGVAAPHVYETKAIYSTPIYCYQTACWTILQTVNYRQPSLSSWKALPGNVVSASSFH